MEETFNTKAIILRRLAFREVDSRITVFSKERGKLNFVVRGTAKPKSKLAAHIEPLNLVDLMAVKGKQFDYAGSVVARESFLNIKKDLDSINTVSEAIKIFNQLVKEEEAESELFFLLYDFLIILDSGLIAKEKQESFKYFFVYKLLVLLGHKPELETCLVCQKKINKEKNIFDFSRGGLVCCKKIGENSFTISVDCVKLLRLLSINNFIFLSKLDINPYLNKEVAKVIRSFYKYIND